MAGVGEDTVLIGNGVPSDDEIRQLDPTPPPEPKEVTPPEDGDENHEDLPDDNADDERRTTEDAEIDAAPTEEAREAIRARRRKERADKRQRAKDKYASLERKLADEKSQRQVLESRLLAIEKTNHSTTVAQLNVAVEQADGALEQLQIAEVNATNAKDANAMLEAKKRIDAIKAHRQTLLDAKAKVEKEVPTAAPQRQSAPEAVVALATAFRRKHTWFVDKNKDLDSRILSDIDNTLLREGWDPASPTYWTELEARGSKYLPDRFKKPAQGGAPMTKEPDNQGQGSESEQPARRSTTVGGAGSGATGAKTGGRQTELSAARVQAIKDVGKWENISDRNKMIKAYQDYDKANGRS